MLTTQPAAAAVTFDPQQIARYRVVPGDVLSIRLYGLEENRYQATLLELRVTDDGKLIMPVIGEVTVAGLDLGAVEKAIRDAHVPSVVRDLAVHVQLLAPRQTTVLVQGAAGAPGLVRLNEKERNPLHALALAGGFGELSSGRVTVRPIATAGQDLTYDFNSIDDVRRALLAPPLQSGDVLIVEASDASVVHVTGLLNRPGDVIIPRDKTMSVMRAISASGGVVDFLDPEEATLWRRLPDGQQVRVKLDLAAIRDGREPDIALVAGDILDVPHTPASRFRAWVAENIRIGPFGVTAMYDPVQDYRARILAREDENTFRRTITNTAAQSLANTVVSPLNVLQQPQPITIVP